MGSDFIRWKEVDILAYLPFFIAKDVEFKSISDADSREHERIRILLIELLKQDNIQTATYALDKWEEFLAIKHKNDNFRDRRKSIIAKLNATYSSTKELLETIANQFIYDKSAEIVPFNEKYMIDLNFTKNMCNNIDDLNREIEEFKPAHIGYVIWEEETVEQNLIIASLVGVEEEIVIKMVKPLENIEIEHGVYYENAVGIEEVTMIGG
ncbi:putative phage tail protein [Veillonella montpellierensis]|uniref:putative phage tail protein n=1 Tax=Veillonella montpellierensis TaxID=187328 RepID=UPI0023F933EF|nr:putative phage tail protein [Veillonella montpellierensis]